MFVVLVEFISHAQHAEDFLNRVKQQAADSLELERECHVFDVCVDPTEATRVVLYEVYTDRAAFQAHLDSDHFKAFDAQVQPWVANKTVSQLQRV